jgi:hypothetical protein
MNLYKENKKDFYNEKGIKIQIFSDEMCKIETKSKDQAFHSVTSRNNNEEFLSENVNSGSLDFSKTVTNLSIQTMRVSKNSMGNSIVNFAGSVRDSVNNLTKLSSLFQGYTSNKNEIDIDNILIDDDSKSFQTINSSHQKNKINQIGNTGDMPNQNDISSSSIIHVNPQKKSEISNQSIFYTPSTICNYYQASNEVTPNKNVNFFDTTNTLKLNLRNLNLITINNNSNSHNIFTNSSNSIYEENITENNENINTSSRNNINALERKTPIKYVKSQLKSGEKDSQNTANNRSNINNRSTSSRGAPSPFVNIFKINSKTVDGSLSAIANEIKKTFNISELEIDEKMIDENHSESKQLSHTPTLDRRNLNNTFNQIKDINNNIPTEETKANSIYEKVIQIKAPAKNENFSFDITHDQKNNNIADVIKNANNYLKNDQILNKKQDHLQLNKDEAANKMNSFPINQNFYPNMKALLKKTNKGKPEINFEKKKPKFTEENYNMLENNDRKMNSGDRVMAINLNSNQGLNYYGHTINADHSTNTNPTIVTVPTQSTNEKSNSSKLSPKLYSTNKNLMTTQASSNKSKASSSQKKISNINTGEELSDFNLKQTTKTNKINMNISNNININKILIQPRNILTLPNSNESALNVLSTNSPSSNILITNLLTTNTVETTGNINRKVPSVDNKNINEVPTNSKKMKFLELFKLYSLKPTGSMTPAYTKKKLTLNSASRCNTFLSHNSKGGSASRGSSGTNKVIELTMQMDQKSHMNSREDTNSNSNINSNTYLKSNQNFNFNKCTPKLNPKLMNKSNLRQNHKQIISPASHRTVIDNFKNLSNHNTSHLSNASNLSYRNNTIKYLDQSRQTENVKVNGNSTNSSIKTSDYKQRISNDGNKNLDGSNKNSVVSILKKNPKVINDFSKYTKKNLSSMSIATNLSAKSKVANKSQDNSSEKPSVKNTNTNNAKRKSTLALDNFLPLNKIPTHKLDNREKIGEIKKQIVSSKINYLIGDEDSDLNDE